LLQATTVERDGNGSPTKVTRPNGAVISMAYDERGNLLTVTEDSIAATTTFSYEPTFSQIITVQAPEGAMTTIDYDANGNPIEITDDAGTMTALAYTDPNCPGQVASVTVAVGLPEENTTTFEYDPLTWNLTRVTDMLMNETSLTYDMAGNVKTVTDAESNTTEFFYDAMNRLTQIRDADNEDTFFMYDAAGNLTHVTDAAGNTTMFAYDSMDRQISMTGPLNMSETYHYDWNGNLDSLMTRKNVPITYDYDAVNRLVVRQLPSGATTYSYDEVGNLLGVTNPVSNLTFTYDKGNRLTSASTAGSPLQPDVTLTYAYDRNGNRMAMTNSLMGTTSYLYDNLDRLTSLTNPSSQNFVFNYDAPGRRTSMNLPNGVTADYTYDVASQLTDLVHVAGVDSLVSFNYTYDQVGNRLTRTRDDTTSAYLYDSLNRLTGATNPSESYDYDAVGNRNPLNSSYGVANRLLDDGTFTYTYDDNGNLETKNDKVTFETTTYTYDAENQLDRIDLPGGTFVEYAYDGLGRRIQKDVNGTATRYVYDNEDIVVEFDESNVQQARYTHGARIDEPLTIERDLDSSGTFESTEVFHYHTDGLGSVVGLTDSLGNLVHSYVYDSFGNIVHENVVTNTGNFYTYTGREVDSESGLYFYRFRYYDPTTGRFLSEDPLGFVDSFNLYPYVRNNPTNYIDPWGLQLGPPPWFNPFQPGPNPPIIQGTPSFRRAALATRLKNLKAKLAAALDELERLKKTKTCSKSGEIQRRRVRRISGLQKNIFRLKDEIGKVEELIKNTPFGDGPMI
jgi:RHS repeat-associated protein